MTPRWKTFLILFVFTRQTLFLFKGGDAWVAISMWNELMKNESIKLQRDEMCFFKLCDWSLILMLLI